MVFLKATTKFNQFLGPFLLRQGLRARFLLSGGVIRDNPRADIWLWIPLAQKLISLEVHDECQQAVEDGFVQPSWREYLMGGKNQRQSKNETSEQTLSPDEESALRIQVLEKYLRPVLLKNERWSDVRIWQFHHRLIRWARAEFLLAKYGPDLRVSRDAFPSLKQSPQLTSRRRGITKLLAKSLPFDDKVDEKRSSKLPSSATVMDAFQMHNWKQSKDPEALGRPMKQLASKLGGRVIELKGKKLRVTHDVPPDQDLSKFLLEEILEVAGGHVATCGSFNALCEEADIYQLWTNDYVDRLGSYLGKRTESFVGTTIVLDVGAGDGLLAQSLRDYFEKRSSQPSSSQRPRNRQRRSLKPQQRPKRYSKMPAIVATDDESWKISPKATVERLSVEESLARFTSSKDQQVIVLCSWMPMGEDWTSSFRKSGVDEYILIGESDDGQCGDNWKTWGNYAFLSALEKDSSRVEDLADLSDAANDVEENIKTTLRPYEVDGYERKDLNAVLPHQFSRFDSAVSKSGTTVSFRRISDE